MTRILEVRGRGNRWKVFYPDEGAITTLVPLFGKDGIQKGFVECGAGSDKFTETSFEGTYEGAVEYAYSLSPGCEVKRVQLMSRGQALEKARKTPRVKDTE